MKSDCYQSFEAARNIEDIVDERGEDEITGYQKVFWSVQLYLECPRCEEDFDFVDTEIFSESDQFNGIEICQKTKNMDAVCPKCEYEFKFDVEGGM